jgi:hypothetical protein
VSNRKAGRSVTQDTVLDRTRLEGVIREFLLAIGEDPAREGLRETPRRIAEMYEEILGGLAIDPTEYLKVGFEVAHDEMVILRDIPFYSMCEHHFLPFHGQAHVGYVPTDGGGHQQTRPWSRGAPAADPGKAHRARSPRRSWRCSSLTVWLSSSKPSTSA